MTDILICCYKMHTTEQLRREIGTKLSYILNQTYKVNRNEIVIPYIDTRILFRPASPEKIKGMRPKYIMCDDYDVLKYFRCLNGVYELVTVRDVLKVILDKCLDRAEEEWNNG